MPCAILNITEVIFVIISVFESDVVNPAYVSNREHQQYKKDTLKYFSQRTIFQRAQIFNLIHINL